MKKTIIIGLCAVLTATSFTSCLDTDSDRFIETGQNLTPQDSVYHLLGVLNNIKAISSRYVLLGELRGDLMVATDYATTELKDLSNWDVKNTNSYVSQIEYYKIINQCNYIIEFGNALPNEQAVATTFRAWTYLQLVLNYGKVVYYEKFISDNDLANADYPEYNIEDLVEVLIPQLEAIKDANFPSYGSIGGVNLQTQFLNPKFVLADCYLWKNGTKEEYKRAAQLYYELIVGRQNTSSIFRYGIDGYMEYNNETVTTSITAPANFNISTGVYAKWAEDAYSVAWFNWNRNNSREVMSYIAIQNRDSTVVRSNIDTLCGYPNYMSSSDPRDVSLKASRVASTLWSTTEYAYIRDEAQYVNYPLLKYVEPDVANYDNPGDLRARASYTVENVNSFGNLINGTPISSFADSVIYKYWNSKSVTLQRTGSLYLRYAEAVNRAGLPNLAMIALKYGLTYYNIFLYMPSEEKPELTSAQVEDAEGNPVTLAIYGGFIYDQRNKQILNSSFIPVDNYLGGYVCAIDSVAKYNGVLPFGTKGLGVYAENDTVLYVFNPNYEDYYDFSSYGNTNLGLHSRGAGTPATDTTFMMPVKVHPGDLLAQQLYMDSVICREYALETAFEGNRFHDLMRFSKYQNDPTFLAKRVASKFGTQYNEYYNKIIKGSTVNGWDDAAWYLPKKYDEK